MVELLVCKNIVFIDKKQEDYQSFVSQFLTKYEEVTKVDFMSRYSKHKTLTTTLEERKLYTEDDDFIMFSRGILELIPKEEYKANYTNDKNEIIQPNLTDEEIRKTLSVFDLRDDQVLAVKKCLLMKRGVIQFPTATGKSAIITSTIKRLLEVNPNMKILVIAPTKSTIKNINDTLVENGLPSQEFGTKSKKIVSPITTALVQTLVQQSDEILDCIGAVFYDECHHLKCETWNKLNTMLSNVEYSLGFSALSIDKSEIYKTDFRDLSYDASLITGCTGRVLLHMDPSYYIERGIIALPIVFQIDHYEKLPRGFDESNWAKLSKTMLQSNERTDKIVKVTNTFSNHNRKTLILVSEKKYAFQLCNKLVESGNQKVGISFGSGVGYTFKGYGPPKRNGESNIDYKATDSMEVVDMLDNGDINVLIATSHLDEGVDVKGLDACVLACGGKKDRRIIQRIGRVLRKTKNGKYAYIIDFTDSGSKILSRQSQLRLNMYKNDIGIPLNNIFENVPIDDIDYKFKRLEEIGE